MTRVRGPLALACLATVHCGTEVIELRPDPSNAGPVPAEAEPDARPAIEPELLPTSPGALLAVPEGSPERDGILRPSAALSPPPGAIEFPLLERGCKKIDFLFVIDDSISMLDEQNNLARSVPGFIAVIEQLLDTVDSHILVTSTSGRADDEAAPTLDPVACESVLGAGKRRSLRGEECGIAGGLPYMVNSQPNLEETFSCVARQGIFGTALQEPVAATLSATSATLNVVGRCNAGFLRDDALLMVTLISDEEDESSAGGPDDWRHALLAAKGGNSEALVMLGLLGDNNREGGLIGGPCGRLDADGAPRLQQLVEGGGGLLGSVCAPDYAPFFQLAAGTVGGAYQEFIPPSLLPQPP